LSSSEGQLGRAGAQNLKSLTRRIGIQVYPVRVLRGQAGGRTIA
jgi:hypothetical protein